MGARLHPALRIECPACAGPMAVEGDALQCRACSQRWPIAGGVAELGHSDSYPCGLDADQLAEMLAIANAAGWQVALHDFLRPIDTALYRRAVDEYRAQWRCLLPRQAGARVLDLRSGWGPVTVGLAEDFGLVVAADPCPAMARFTALRARAMGLANVQTVTLDPRQRLPFPAGGFDVVVLHELLEWQAAGGLLREAARVLRPGGALFLSAANRLSLAHLASRSAPADATAALRPRPATLPDYRRALAAAGLVAGKAYAILPAETEPFYLVPLDSPGALRYFLDNLFEDAGLHRALSQRGLLGPYRLARAAWRAARFGPVEWLVRYVVPAYGLLATRPAPA